MSARSNDQGRAYEFAWMLVLNNALRQFGNPQVARNSSLDANHKAWLAMSSETQKIFVTSAQSAVDVILEAEPRMRENDGSELRLAFQKDDAGTKGDVRDIVIRRDSINWEVGLSIKHNHEAVKHSRLSHKLDFGKEWFGRPCSAQYWHTVTPIFDRLKVEKRNGTKWSALGDKEGTVYIPLLKAFVEEVRRACRQDASVPKKMIEYLIGTKDYYKIVSHDRMCSTTIHAFNTHGTLNKPGKIKGSSIRVPFTIMPTAMFKAILEPGSTNTADIYLNYEWALSFRIHNASTTVEPSLKFDIQFMHMPALIRRIECKWK